MRPAAPKVTPEPGFYTEYISVTAETENGVLYVEAPAYTLDPAVLFLK